MRLAVVIASTGRPDCLDALVRTLLRQTRVPDRIILSVARAEDLPTDSEVLSSIDHCMGPRGLPSQRNTGLDMLDGNADVVAFFDDDYVPAGNCIEQIGRFFTANPHVAGANGRLLADGINTPGLNFADAERLFHEHAADVAGAGLDIAGPLKGLYGCNMVYRMESIAGLRFDDRLKLYGWQEDIDFAVQAGRRGAIVRTDAFAGVHLGVKSGRTSGLKFGYSQVVNPLYLRSKGTMGTGFALRLMAHNVIANHLRVFLPEPWVDRAGRVRGNWLGLMDAMRGRLTPERIEAL